MEDVEYRPIPGYPPCLRAGNDGSIWLQESETWGRVPICAGRGLQTWCRLYSGGQLFHVSVAKLVLLAFGGPPPPNVVRPVAYFRDGDPRNCRADNLEWQSQSEKAKRACRDNPPDDDGSLRAGIQRKIWERRQRLRLSLAQAAAKAGFKKATEWWHIEKKKNISLLVTLLRIALALDCDIQALMPEDWRERMRNEPPTRGRKRHRRGHL